MPRFPKLIAMISSPHFWTRIAWLVVLGTFGYLLVWVATHYRFPSRFDELQHLSVVRHQFENPDLFADASRYGMVDAKDVTRWTEGRNYINHPPLYYLLMSLYMHVSDSPFVGRLINAALAMVALILVIYAGSRLFARPLEKAIFAIIAACFPKAALVGAMVNNDNLASIAAAVVFAGLMGMGGAIWWLALGIVLAGWTKLTALLMLGTVVACHRMYLILSRQVHARSRDNAILIIAAMLGALPYIVTFVNHGYLLYVNEAVWFVPAHQRPSYDFFDYLAYFLQKMVMKWSASELSLPWPIALVTVSIPLLMSVVGLFSRSPASKIITPVIWCYLAGLTVMLLEHITFGWVAFTKIGDLTIAQTRYYNVVWPGFALAGTVGVMMIARLSRLLTVPVLIFYILPTLLGALTLLTFSVRWPAFLY